MPFRLLSCIDRIRVRHRRLGSSQLCNYKSRHQQQWKQQQEERQNRKGNQHKSLEKGGDRKKEKRKKGLYGCCCHCRLHRWCCQWMPFSVGVFFSTITTNKSGWMLLLWHSHTQRWYTDTYTHTGGIQLHLQQTEVTSGHWTPCATAQQHLHIVCITIEKE